MTKAQRDFNEHDLEKWTESCYRSVFIAKDDCFKYGLNNESVNRGR